MKKSILEKKTILVIEDERSLLEVVKARLTTSGFTVITARSVDQVFNANLDKESADPLTPKMIKQVLQHLEKLEQVDAIWLDHNLLGKETGLDLVKKIKSNGKRWKSIPIFVISNSENTKTIKSYTALGITKYYIKSNNKLDEIIKDIREYLNKKTK